MNTPVLAASILAADFARLGQQVQACAEAGVPWVHFDVMDGRFVPNISIGLPVLSSLRKATGLVLDVHLMMVEPERYLADFAKAGADWITLHAEATPHTHRAVQMIKELGLKAGIAINPGTPVEALAPLLPQLDLALLMTVNPGFGGQSFIEASVNRLQTLKTLRDHLNPHCLIEVDGGITAQTAPQAVNAGAQVLVAGTAIFAGDIAHNVARLKESYAAAG